MIAENDYFNLNMKLMRPDSEGHMFFATVAYKSVEKVHLCHDAFCVYKEGGFSQYISEPERYGYRYGPVLGDETEIPVKALQKEMVKPVLVVILVYSF